MILMLIDPEEKGKRAVMDIRCCNEDEFKQTTKEVIENNFQDPVPPTALAALEEVDWQAAPEAVLRIINKALQKDEESERAWQIYVF